VFLHEASHAVACKLTCGDVRSFLTSTTSLQMNLKGYKIDFRSLEPLI